MRERWKARPQLEPLETMTLLSGAAATALSQNGHSQVPITKTPMDLTLTLTGTEHGVFLARQSSSGKTYDIAAAGMLSPIGPTAAPGNLHVVSGISSGPPNGTLHLVTRKGILTLQIPESVDLPAGLPTATSTNEIVDTYVITKGTGAYKGDSGSGIVEFTLRGAHPTGAKVQVGLIDITFTSLPVLSPTASIFPTTQ